MTKRRRQSARSPLRGRTWAKSSVSSSASRHNSAVVPPRGCSPDTLASSCVPSSTTWTARNGSTASARTSGGISNRRVSAVLRRNAGWMPRRGIRRSGTAPLHRPGCDHRWLPTAIRRAGVATRGALTADETRMAGGWYAHGSGWRASCDDLVPGGRRSLGEGGGWTATHQRSGGRCHLGDPAIHSPHGDSSFREGGAWCRSGP